MNEENEIKPCPKCGEAWVFADEQMENTFLYTINCKCLYAWKHTGWSRTRQETIKKWNEALKNGL